MEKYKLKAVHFGESDVIATSSKDPIPSSVTTIWLSKESVLNFNAFSDSDIDLDCNNKSYFSYTGSISSSNLFSYAQAKTNAPTDVTLYSVSSKNKSEYETVLNWLNDYEARNPD